MPCGRMLAGHEPTMRCHTGIITFSEPADGPSFHQRYALCETLGAKNERLFLPLFSWLVRQLISHVLRLREPHERLALLNITVSTLPSMYIRGFKRTATNIVDYYEAMGDDCADPDLRSMVRSSAQDAGFAWICLVWALRRSSLAAYGAGRL